MIAASSGSSYSTHALGDDAAGRHSTQQVRAEVAVHRRDDVAWTERLSGADGNGFVSLLGIDDSRDFSLLEERQDPVVEATSKLHPVEDFQPVLSGQRRPSGRREGHSASSCCASSRCASSCCASSCCARDSVSVVHAVFPSKPQVRICAPNWSSSGPSIESRIALISSSCNERSSEQKVSLNERLFLPSSS